jgi:hypothetical protein
MHPAEQLSQNQNQEHDRESRTRVDTIAWLAEVLDGNMRVPPSEYFFDGAELYAEDGGSIGKVFEDAVTEARQIVEVNPSLFFELRRRLIEYDEYQDMLSMARGDFNTMVVVSDFPPELMNSPEDVGGYNASRKQTMLRVITRQADGQLRIITQSLDGSNRQALEELYGYMNQPVKPGELLEQRVKRDLSIDQQDQLLDDLTNVYDVSLGVQFDGEWRGGRQQDEKPEIIDTYEFVTAQEDLIEWFASIKLTDPRQAENLRFRLAAEANTRFQSDKAQGFITVRSATVLHDETNLQTFCQAMDHSAQLAHMMGMVFSGCGASVGGSLAETQLAEAGYGNQAGSDKYGSLQFRCRNGHLNTRERNRLIPHCQHCGVSVKC